MAPPVNADRLDADHPDDAAVLPPHTAPTDRTGERELVVLCGLQAAGKSTFAARRLAATHAAVSKDRMRSARNKERRQTELVRDHLAAGRDVVVDNTNATVAARRRLIELGREAGARVVGYWFPVEIGVALVRNARRSGRARVPPVAIHATAKRLEPPTPAEGFDSLHTVVVRDDGGFDVRPWQPAAPARPSGVAPRAAG